MGDGDSDGRGDDDDDDSSDDDDQAVRTRDGRGGVTWNIDGRSVVTRASGTAAR